MKPGAFASMFRRSAREKGERIRAHYLKAGMSGDMADLLAVMTGLADMPRDKRHTTPAGRALWVKWMAGCALVENNFEAFAQNRAFEEFRSELKRLAAQVDASAGAGEHRRKDARP